MESNYDEDLSSNIFFTTLQSEYPELYEKAILENWIICIPRSDSLMYPLTLNDYCNHILIPNDELPETHFRTLSLKEVKICNRNVIVENDVGSHNTQVLFEETFYTQDSSKYKVLCIEFPLEQPKSQAGVVNVNSLRDCIDLLWIEGGKEALVSLDEMIQTFLSQQLEFKHLQELKDLVNILYKKCLDIVTKELRLRDKTNYFLDNVKVSVESYVQHGIYNNLMKAIAGCTAYDDACLNKTIKNLSDLQLKDLKIDSQFASVIPKARSELNKLDGYSTVLGKVGCLKKTLNAITDLDQYGKMSNVIAADDLLPMLAFLLVKSGTPNWMSQLTFMTEFSYSAINYYSNQNSFLITSLEAALTFIRSENITAEPEIEPEIESKIFQLFNAAKIGDEKKVETILNSKCSLSFAGMNLCHPLCDCDKCEKELNKTLNRLDPKVNTCDDHNYTVLHIAAIYGQAKVVDMLLSLGADPNIFDFKGQTALHHASARGHQNTLLILVHANSKINYIDNDGNTPLHLAACNGHETCVKALLYFAEHAAANFNINCVNSLGDTALHNASKWGYTNIVSILLDYGASPLVQNKRKLNCFDIAHNIHVLELLSKPKREKLSLVHLQNATSQLSLTTSSSNSSQFDFTEEETDSFFSNKSNFGVRPNTTEGIKKVEKLIKAITHGDIALACFYLGLELNPKHKSPCHPLCQCKVAQSGLPTTLNLNVCNSQGLTALHESSRTGLTELVKLLVDASCDLNIRTIKTNMTPLHMACQNRKKEVVKILLNTKKIDLEARDVFGNTALHYAAQTNDTELVKLFLNHNVNLNARNQEGKTPLDEAKDRMSISTIQLFMEF